MAHLPKSGHRPPRPVRSGEKKFNWAVAINDAVGEEATSYPSRPFHARFSGRCAGCGEPYVAGERVAYVAARSLAHEGCEEVQVPVTEASTEEVMGMGPKQIAAVRKNICPTHFVEKSRAGICGECELG
jgi:hypothetical protein